MLQPVIGCAFVVRAAPWRSRSTVLPRDVEASGGSSSERSGFVAYARSGNRPAYLVLFGSEAGAPLCSLPVRA
jgi:hypothetical protein